MMMLILTLYYYHLCYFVHCVDNCILFIKLDNDSIHDDVDDNVDDDDDDDKVLLSDIDYALDIRLLT